MGCVSRKQEASNSHPVNTSLMDFVRTEVDKPIFVRGWIAGQDCLKFGWLSLLELVIGESTDLAISYAVKPIRLYPCNHVPRVISEPVDGNARYQES